MSIHMRSQTGEVQSHSLMVKFVAPLAGVVGALYGGSLAGTPPVEPSAHALAELPEGWSIRLESNGIKFKKFVLQQTKFTFDYPEEGDEGYDELPEEVKVPDLYNEYGLYFQINEICKGESECGSDYTVECMLLFEMVKLLKGDKDFTDTLRIRGTRPRGYMSISALSYFLPAIPANDDLIADVNGAFMSDVIRRRAAGQRIRTDSGGHLGEKKSGDPDVHPINAGQGTTMRTMDPLLFANVILAAKKIGPRYVWNMWDCCDSTDIWYITGSDSENWNLLDVDKEAREKWGFLVEDFGDD